MSDKEIPEFKVPKSKIDFRRIFPTDPNFSPITQISDQKMKFIGKICRFKGMINQNLFELIKDDLLENLILLYGKTIQKIT